MLSEVSEETPVFGICFSMNYSAKSMLPDGSEPHGGFEIVSENKGPSVRPAVLRGLASSIWHFAILRPGGQPTSISLNRSAPTGPFARRSSQDDVDELNLGNDQHRREMTAEDLGSCHEHQADPGRPRVRPAAADVEAEQCPGQMGHNVYHT